MHIAPVLYRTITLERYIAYDEKPLSIFFDLKDSNRNPAFVIRHVREIDTHLAEAQAAYFQQTMGVREEKAKL